MKTTELRIGNHYTDKGIWLTASEIRADQVLCITKNKEGILTVYTKNPKPIKLTRVILGSFGFEKRDGFYEYHLSHDTVLIEGDKNGFYEVFLLHDDNIRVKYLHELQNIFFVLTGKELVRN